jgi:branched-chain amino acid transport system permease protein
LLVDGALAGAIYALIALAFVLVYKSSRMINFAVGEWIMLGALVAGAGYHAIGLGLAGAVLFAAAAMAVFGVAFNCIVVGRLTSHIVISLIMVTIGLGAMMRGTSALVFTGIPSGIPLPVSAEPLLMNGFPVSPEKLIAALIAGAGIALLTLLYHHSRTGIALRAIADDPTAASAAGINTHRLFALVWAITGVTSVLAGILWVFVTGGGFGVALVGLKIFPIVVVGGLDSLPGTIVAAMLIGVFESLGAGYLDPQIGPGFGTIASYVLLLAMLIVRPYGLFGRAPAVRV